MLKLIMFGQNVGFTMPNVTLTGDPGVDQPVLAAAGYKGGRIVAASKQGTNLNGVGNTDYGVVVVPCDADSMNPLGTLINGGGEYATSIGPSGSKRAPIMRQLWIGEIDSESYDTQAGVTFKVGSYVYCGGTTNNNIGLYTDAAHAGVVGSEAALSIPVGICLHVPTTTEPYLVVASLL